MFALDNRLQNSVIAILSKYIFNSDAHLSYVISDSSPIMQTRIGTNRASYHHPSSQLSLVTLLTHHASLHTSYTLELGADVLADASLLSLATTNNTAVHGARHAVLLLDVQLGEGVLYESAPHCKTDARKRKRRGYLSGKTRPRCFSPGNASRPYPTRSHPVSPASTLPTQRPQWVQRTGFT